MPHPHAARTCPGLVPARASRGGWERIGRSAGMGVLLCVTLVSLTGCALFDRAGGASDPRGEILAAATEFAAAGDLAAAEAKLAEVDAPNPRQLLLVTAEEVVRSGDDLPLATALVQLADALGLTSVPLTEFAAANGLALNSAMPAVAAGQAAAPPAEDQAGTNAMSAAGVENAADESAAAGATNPGESAAENAPESDTAQEETAQATPVLATPTPEPTATPTPDVAPKARVTSPLNVRNGPGTAYTIVGGLQAGETIDIRGKNAAADWWQVALEGGVVGWVYAPLVEASGDLNAVTVVNDIPAPPEPTPPPAVVEAEPEPAPEEAAAPPASEGPHFTMVNKRLWDVYENGGRLSGSSVVCGEKRQLQVQVLDAAGQPINGVVVQAQLGARESEVTGSKGPGIAEFVLGGGQEVKVVRDADGRDATSDVAYGLTTKPWEIPFEYLIAGQFCGDNDSCQSFVDAPGCYGHYSWTVTYQRNY